MLTSITLDFFTYDTYFVNNTYVRQLPAQYIYAIMWYKIGYNIVNIANQLFFRVSKHYSQAESLYLLFYWGDKNFRFYIYVEKEVKGLVYENDNP